jgi:hypothetical protein
MIELANAGEIKIVDRNEIDIYQQTGWRAIGMTTEDVIEDRQQEVICRGGDSNGNNGCSHGNYNGNCTIKDLIDVPIKVQRPLVILTRDEDSISTELGALKSAHGHLEEADRASRSELDSTTREHRKTTEKLEESDRIRETLTADLEEMSKVNARVCDERRVVMDENMALRTEVHTFTMGRVVRASELACTGAPMHPLAFAYLLDSLDRITAEPSAYVGLIAEMVKKRIIVTIKDDDGNVSVKVTDNDKFRTELRVLDSQTRLGVVRDDDEIEF